ncbi:MAG: hypothetical protein IPP51_00655 [Bacteroidetes bacterium]|nr:hypothetical protein [Bacteroidota bacterium]
MLTNKKNFPGIYFRPAFIIISLFLFLSSCTKEDFNPSVTTETPPSDMSMNRQLIPELFGIYTHPNYLTIGNTTSENTFLNYLRSKGGNMVNCYARNSMTTATERSKFAAFCRKAVSTYGIKLITCDIRETSEIARWDALYTSYPDLRTVVSPLTEKEPWITRDYAGCFSLLRLTKAMCNRYGAKFYFYEGWMGSNYVNPQAAVDSMVYYCDGVFISNYVTVTDYLSTGAGYGKWDNRMKLRIDQGASAFGGIALAAKKFSKLDYPIIELQSLEPSFLLTMYSIIGANRMFFGTLYGEAKGLYNLSSLNVLKYTELKGKTIFYQRYAQQAQPN